jgi:AcrR family transcriptional regulator
MPQATPDQFAGSADADWHRRVVNRSLRTATKRSIDRGSALIRAAAALLERSNGDGFTVQDVADEAGQSLRTLYQYFESKDDLLLAVFEEGQRSYAHLIRDAVAALTDPLERLAGGLVAAVLLPEYTDAGVNRGLTRLRLKLTEVKPELVAGSRAPVASLVLELVEDAAAAGRIAPRAPGPAAFLLLSLKTASLTSATLGNDVGVPAPGVEELVAFCLQGLGAELEPGWFASISARLRLPSGRISMAAAPP